MERPRSSTATWRRRCSMARKRASMREGPLAELFRATEAAQKQAEREAAGAAAEAPAPARRKKSEPAEETVEHVPAWSDAAESALPEPEEPKVEPEAARPRLESVPEPPSRLPESP